MMRRQTIAELGEQPSAIAAAADHQLLERPGLAGAQSQSLGVDNRSEALFLFTHTRPFFFPLIRIP